MYRYLSALIIVFSFTSIYAVAEKTNVFSEAVQGHLKAVQDYIDGGGDVNIQDDNGWTLLMMATDANNIDMVKLLLKAKANANIQNTSATTRVTTPIVKTTEGSMSITTGGDQTLGIRLATREGGDDCPYDNGCTALMMAAIEGYSDLVSLLIEAKSNLNIVSASGKTALMHAISGYDYENEGKIESSKLSIIQRLVHAKADLSIKDKEDQWTALMYALSRDSSDAVRNKAREDIALYLIACGVGLETKAKNGFTPLMLAAENNEAKPLKALLKANVKVDYAKDDGVTALIVAAGNGSADATSILLGAKANVSAKTKSGWTALMEAVSANSADVVKLLIAAKADPNYSVPDDGETALMVAAENGNDVLAQLLKDSGAKVGPLEAAALGDSDSIAFYLKKADVNAPMNKKNWTLLMEASQAGRPQVVKQLIDAKADINARDSEGDTALMEAADCSGGDESRYADTMTSLIDAHADVNAVTKDGRTALMRAVRVDKPFVKAVQILHDANADITLKDHEGKSVSNYIAARIKTAGAAGDGTLPLFSEMADILNITLGESDEE
jgi:ankyrin repeat protein